MHTVENRVRSGASTIDRMNELLQAVLRKHACSGFGNFGDESSRSRGKTVIERIELLCRLMENNVQRHSEETPSRRPSHLPGKNTEQSTIEIEEGLLAIQKERSSLEQFRRDVDRAGAAAEHLSNSIEANFQVQLERLSVAFASRVRGENWKNGTQRRDMRAEMELFDRCAKSRRRVRREEACTLYDARCKARTRCLSKLVKYDTDIGALYTRRADLREEMNFTEEEYTATQEQLIAQRNLYELSRMEREATRRRALFAKVEEFRRNRAAKVIQRNWRMVRHARFARRKRKSRKCDAPSTLL